MSTYNYYFDSDERDYTVIPPKITKEELDELNNSDENWFKYMLNKDKIELHTNSKNNQITNYDFLDYEDEETSDEEYFSEDDECCVE